MNVGSIKPPPLTMGNFGLEIETCLRIEWPTTCIRKKTPANFKFVTLATTRRAAIPHIFLRAHKKTIWKTNAEKDGKQQDCAMVLIPCRIEYLVEIVPDPGVAFKADQEAIIIR